MAIFSYLVEMKLLLVRSIKEFLYIIEQYITSKRDIREQVFAHRSFSGGNAETQRTQWPALSHSKLLVWVSSHCLPLILEAACFSKIVLWTHFSNLTKQLHN